MGYHQNFNKLLWRSRQSSGLKGSAPAGSLGDKVKNMELLNGSGFGDRVQNQCRPPAVISEEGELRSAVSCQVMCLMCHTFTNDLLTEQGQQRSRVIRKIIDTTQRSLENRNQIDLITLEITDLGHKIRSFSTTQYL